MAVREFWLRWPTSAVLVLLLWCSFVRAQTCPKGCKCEGLSVTCANGLMQYVPPGIPINTTHLNFSNNSLTIIRNQTQLHNLPNLRTLSLWKNRIIAIEDGAFWGHSALKNLDLSYNDLRIVNRSAFRGLPGLNTLDLHGNPRLCLDFGSLGTLPNLQRLVLGYTNVIFIPGLFQTSSGNLNPPVGLLDLQLWEMGLLRIPYEAIKELPNLSELNMSQNKIKCIHHFAFTSNGNLTLLDLSSNPIAIVHSDAFEGLAKLSTLLLDNTNTLTMLPEGVFDPLPNGVKICLYGNKWNCDCHIKWLKSWTEEEGRVHCAQKPNCHTPSDLQGNPFFTVPKELFQCDGSVLNLPNVACYSDVKYTDGFCLELQQKHNIPMTTTTSSPSTDPITKKKVSTPTLSPTMHQSKIGFIVTGVSIMLIVILIVGVFIARQIRIQKKLHDQNKYFNISYENGDSQLQMAESPTPEKEKVFH